MTTGIRTWANWLLGYRSGSTVGAHFPEEQSEVHIPEAHNALPALCPQRKHLPSELLELLQPPLAPLAPLPPLQQLLSSGRWPYPHRGRQPHVNRPSRLPWSKVGWLRSREGRNFPCISLTLGPGTVSTKMPGGFLGSSIVSSQEPDLRHNGIESEAWLESTPSSNSVRWAHFRGAGGLSYGVG